MNSHLEQGRPRTNGSTSASSAPTGRASASFASLHAGNMAASTRKLFLASFTSEDDEEGSAIGLKREIERMVNRCARLGALVARLVAGQQREHQEEGSGGRGGGGDGDGEDKEQRQSERFAAAEVQFHANHRFGCGLDWGFTGRGCLVETPKHTRARVREKPGCEPFSFPLSPLPTPTTRSCLSRSSLTTIGTTSTRLLGHQLASQALEQLSNRLILRLGRKLRKTNVHSHNCR